MAPLDRLLEQTSKLVLRFGRCVGSLCNSAVLVARDITLPLWRKYLLGCVMILHESIFSHYGQNDQWAWCSLRAADEMRFVSRNLRTAVNRRVRVPY